MAEDFRNGEQERNFDCDQCNKLVLKILLKIQDTMEYKEKNKIHVYHKAVN